MPISENFTIIFHVILLFDSGLYFLFQLKIIFMANAHVFKFFVFCLVKTHCIKHCVHPV